MFIDVVLLRSVPIQLLVKMGRLLAAVTLRQKYVFRLTLLYKCIELFCFTKVCLANAASLPCPDVSCDSKTAGLNGKTCQRYAASKSLNFIRFVFGENWFVHSWIIFADSMGHCDASSNCITQCIEVPGQSQVQISAVIAVFFSSFSNLKSMNDIIFWRQLYSVVVQNVFDQVHVRQAILFQTGTVLPNSVSSRMK